MGVNKGLIWTCLFCSFVKIINTRCKVTRLHRRHFHKGLLGNHAKNFTGDNNENKKIGSDICKYPYSNFYDDLIQQKASGE